MVAALRAEIKQLQNDAANVRSERAGAAKALEKANTNTLRWLEEAQWAAGWLIKVWGSYKNHPDYQRAKRIVGGG